MFFLRRRPRATPFAFRDLGPLADGDLTLVPPTRDRAEAFLASVAHPLCRDEPECKVTRLGLEAFLHAVPDGRERCDPRRDGGIRAAYRFWMRLANGPIEYAGTLTLRVGRGGDLERYLGHVGYVVHPPARGRSLAARATRLILPLARSHGLRELWITCNPDNAASRRTAERLGAVYVETVSVPRRHPLYARGDREKRRYVLVI